MALYVCLGRRADDPARGGDDGRSHRRQPRRWHGEVLDEADAWPVAEIDDAEEYVKAIREVLADTAAARQRALALRERLLHERSEAAFAEQVTGLLLVDGGGKA